MSSNHEAFEVLLKKMPDRTSKVYNSAEKSCSKIKDNCKEILTGYLQKTGLDENKICFVAVGSVGRMEALNASDLDMLPILKDRATLQCFKKVHDKAIRKLLGSELGLHISEGKDLTKCEQLANITNGKTVGGEKDNSPALTRRVLLLTEGIQLAGGLSLSEIRSKVLKCYSDQETTSGRHVFSLSNDIARYYRTLCIEYKAKVDTGEKSWGTRNLKLRHSRKFWYFASILSMASLADQFPDRTDYARELLIELDSPPIHRLANAADRLKPLSVIEIYERYAYFLGFMATKNHRKKIELINYENRHDLKISNPFIGMKLNSDLMHQEMIRVIENLPVHVRENIYKWFLL